MSLPSENIDNQTENIMIDLNNILSKK